MPRTLPTSSDRRLLPLALYLHPFEVLLGVVLVLIGARSLGLGVEPPSIEQAVGPPTSYAWLIGNLLGGILILAGVFGHAYAFPRALEKAGLYLVSGTTSAYAVALLDNVGEEAGYTVAILAAITGSCLVRARAIRRAELAVLETLTAVNAGAAELHPVELVQPRRRATDAAP